MSRFQTIYQHLFISPYGCCSALPALSRNSHRLAVTLISLHILPCPTMIQIAEKAQKLRVRKSYEQGYGQDIHRTCGYPRSRLSTVTSRPVSIATILNYGTFPQEKRSRQRRKMSCSFGKNLDHAERWTIVFAQLLSNAKKYVFDKFSDLPKTISP